MKHVLLIGAFLAGAICVSAQKVDETKVPSAVKTKFNALYPNISKVKWEEEDGNYEANFDKGKTEMSVLISPAGQLKETEESIAYQYLPRGAGAYIKTNLPGKKITEASKITDANGKVTYEAEVDGMDYTFDENGNFLKKEADND